MILVLIIILRYLQDVIRLLAHQENIRNVIYSLLGDVLQVLVFETLLLIACGLIVTFLNIIIIYRTLILIHVLCYPFHEKNLRHLKCTYQELLI